MAIKIVGYMKRGTKEESVNLSEQAALELAMSPTRRKSAGLVYIQVSEKTSKEIDTNKQGVFTKKKGD